MSSAIGGILKKNILANAKKVYEIEKIVTKPVVEKLFRASAIKQNFYNVAKK